MILTHRPGPRTQSRKITILHLLYNFKKRKKSVTEVRLLVEGERQNSVNNISSNKAKPKPRIFPSLNEEALHLAVKVVAKVKVKVEEGEIHYHHHHKKLDPPFHLEEIMQEANLSTQKLALMPRLLVTNRLLIRLRTILP